MIRRTAAALTIVSTLLIPAAALADADAGDTDAGSAGSVDPECNVTSQTQAGETCQLCQFTGSDIVCPSQLGDQYNFACKYSDTVEVWCNGPARTQSASQGCALGGAPLATGAPAGTALVLALGGLALWSRRRRA